MTTEQIVDEVRARRFGVCTETMKLIGYGTLLWNCIEAEFINLIIAISGWNRETGRIVVVDLQNVTRVQLARNLLSLSDIDTGIVQHTKCILLLFDQMRGARNGFIHGIPMHQHDDPERSLVVRVEAKKGDGSITFTELDLTREYMEKFVYAADILNIALDHTYYLIKRDHKYRRSPKLRQKHTHAEYVWQGAGRGPEEDAIEAARVSLLPPLQTQKAHRKNLKSSSP